MGGLGFYARDDIKASEKRAELNAYCTGDLEVWDLEIWDLEIWDLEVWDLERTQVLGLGAPRSAQGYSFVVALCGSISSQCQAPVPSAST